MNESTHPDQLENPSDPSARLRSVLVAGQREILEQWIADVRTMSATQGLSDRVIVNHLPQILKQVTQLLEPGYRARWASLAALGEAHAIDRLSHGFELDQVIFEYRLLRRTIARAWGQRIGRDITIPELMALDEAIDESVRQAVVQYASSRERLLRGLNQVSEAAAQSASLEAFLQALLHATVETLGSVDTAVVLLRDDDLLSVRAAIGLEEELRDGFVLRIGEGFAGRIASLAQPLELTEAAKDPVVKSPIVRNKGVRALYGVPLIQQGDVIGVAHIGSLSATEFPEETKLLFRTMASRASSFVAKARLQQRLREAEAVQRMLAEVGRQVGESLDADTALSRLAHTAVPTVADWCVVDVLTEEGVRRVSMGHADPAKELVAREIERRFPLDLNGPSAIARAIRLGKVEHVAHFSGEAVATIAQNSEHAELLRMLSIRSYIVAPILANRHTIGAVTLVYADSGRRYRAEDLAIAEELARRAGSALENARLYDEARAAIETRDQLLAVVSHDLRNHLGVVTTSAALLEELTKRSDGAIGQSILAAKRATGAMKRLLDDLLDSAAIRAGRLSVAAKAIALDPLLREQYDVHLPIATSAGISLQMRPVGADVQVLADRDRIAQVLSNLLVNALRYAGRGAQVTIEAAADVRAVRIIVSDTGSGIPPEDLPELFKPYRRGSGGITGGTGLGLFISKGIVERHGGRIACESRVGHGTAFSFTLPRAS